METAEITKNLNTKQQEAVTFGDGPLLIVAGAGTGKTTVVTQRIAWLVMSGKAKPEEILALTFTDKAAGEMEERVDQLLPYGYVDLWVSTFHAFCERVLKQHAIDIGLTSDFKLLDSTAQWLLVRENLDKFDLDYYRPLGNPTKFIHALLRHFSRAKDEAISPADYLDFAQGLKINQDAMESTGGKAKKARGVKKVVVDLEKNAEELDAVRLNEVAEAYHVYQQLLLDNNYLDFGDLINYTLKLFQTRPQILKKYQEQFKYILVDEFQDTNWAQYQLVKMLAEPKNNLTVVGDDDQSIYRFRGASLSNILEFKSDYPKSKQVVLTENYRSAQNILDLAYQFIQHNNPNRLECRLNDSPDILAQAKSKGVNLKNFQKIDKQLKAAKAEAGEIEFLSFATGAEEARGVLQKIVDIKRSKPEVLWSDFAILVRANSQAKVFNAALGNAGIPFQFLALRGLYSKEIILDILAYFRLLDNYHESPAVWRVINMPALKLPSQDLIELVHQANRQSWSLFESLQKAALIKKITPKTFDEINKLLTLVAKHTELARSKSVSELFVCVINDLGILALWREATTQEAQDNLSYLRQFFEKIRSFEEGLTEPNLKKFMAKINLELEAGEEGELSFDVEAGPETVKVMTVHGAKGLEFKYVFVVNLVAQRFPTNERGEAIELPENLVKEVVPVGDIHLEEERRLFYVALTRAKQGLFLTWAKNYGGTRQKKMSRFLTELGQAADNQKARIDQPDFSVAAPNHQATAAKLPTPKKFTYSQLSSFEKCPLQYKYAYVLRIPTFGKAALSFGSSVHLTLQKFFTLMVESGGGQVDLFGQAKNTKQVLPSKEKLLECYEASWQDTWYDDAKSKKEYYEKGKRILSEYYKVLQQNTPEPVRLESPFVLKIGQHSLAGRVDRIDQTATGIEIIDYKTGSAKDGVGDVDQDQLLIYQLAAEEHFGLKPAKLTYYYIEEGKAVSFLGSDKDKEKIKEKIVATIKAIQDSNFEPTPGWPCKFCDFKSICPFREL